MSAAESLGYDHGHDVWARDLELQYARDLYAVACGETTMARAVESCVAWRVARGEEDTSHLWRAVGRDLRELSATS